MKYAEEIDIREANQPVEEQLSQHTQTKGVNKSNGLELLAQVSTLSWDLVVPIVGGVLLGSYIDNRTESGFTWTLSLLVLGVLIAFGNLYNLYHDHGRQQVQGNARTDADEVLNDKKE
jgi:predicted F0F1-ATPase subunit